MADLSDARNAGTKEAIGKYIVYIDSDDYILDKEFLSKLAQKTKTGVDLIFYKYQKYFNETKKLEDCTYTYSLAMSETLYANKIEALVKADAFYGMAWIKAVKRKLIVENNINFEVGLLGEDMDWNYQVIFNAPTIEFIDEPMIAYRQRRRINNFHSYIKKLSRFCLYFRKMVKSYYK